MLRRGLLLILTLFAIQSVFAMGKDPALIVAVDEGDKAEVRKLIAQGANVDEVNWQGRTPLVIAAQFGRLGIAKLLLDHGANVNAQAAADANHVFPLEVAARRGYYAIAKLLLDKGANINMVDGWGRTALHEAAYYGYESIVRLLLARGADRNVADMHGMTPLGFAQMEGHAGVVRLLTEESATP